MFDFLCSMGFHGLPHCFDLLRLKGIVHELEVVFCSDIIKDEDTDIEGTIFHDILFLGDEMVHAAHYYLKCVWIDLSD